MDNLVEKFIPRDSYPVLTINRETVALPMDNTNVQTQGQGQGQVQGQNVELYAPDYYLNIARELRIPLDTYELSPSPGAPLSIKKSLGVGSHEKCHVTVQGSGRPNTIDASASVGSSILTSYANMSASAINGNTHTVPPFAILLPYSRIPGSCELRVMPFNYPIILPILKKAIEQVKKCQSLLMPQSQIFSQPWAELCSKEIFAYLHTVPSYAYLQVRDVLSMLYYINTLLSTLFDACYSLNTVSL